MRVDLHCHLLPGIDDGAQDLEQALAMVELAVADGTTDVVCTPHHLNGVYTNDAASVRTRCHALQRAIDRAGLALRVHPGAEHHLVPELPAALADGSALTLADRGRHAMVELPVLTVPVGADALLQAVLAQGLTPIIVHPERNDTLRRHPEILTRWVGWGCLGQVTAQSLTGEFGPAVRQAAHAMVGRGCIHCIGSDAHRDRRRVPVLSRGRAELATCFGEEVAGLLTDDIPARLLAGRPIDGRAVTDAVGGGTHSHHALAKRARWSWVARLRARLFGSPRDA